MFFLLPSGEYIFPVKKTSRISYLSLIFYKFYLNWRKNQQPLSFFQLSAIKHLTEIKNIHTHIHLISVIERRVLFTFLYRQRVSVLLKCCCFIYFKCIVMSVCELFIVIFLFNLGSSKRQAGWIFSYPLSKALFKGMKFK